MILTFDNKKSELLVIMLEPWGEQYELKKGDSIKLFFREVNDSELEIVNCDGYIQIYPGRDSDHPIKITVNGNEVEGGYGDYLNNW